MTRTSWSLAASVALLLPPATYAAAPPALSETLVALSAPASSRDVLSVVELRSGLVGDDRRRVDAESLAAEIRDVARRSFSSARVLDGAAAREGCATECRIAEAQQAGATLLLTGEVLRVESGFLVSLELRSAPSRKLLATASGTSTSADELAETAASVTVDLFRGYKSAATVAAVLGSVPLPAVPAPSPALAEDGVLHLDIDANALVAYDAAKNLDPHGSERPDDAAAAWRAVAEAGGAANPLRDMAAARARQWQDYADGKRAFEAQLARDTDRLRKVLPLGSVTDATKVDLLVRYAAAYGAERATPLVELLPAPAVRDRARLAIGCETKTAASCAALARAAETANDAASALTYYDRACELDDAAACAEAAERWLQPASRDVARAIVALQHGCASAATDRAGQALPPPAGAAAACARLARLYEEGDGTPANPALATEMRDKACAAGDGSSCRRLACAVDASAAPAEQARASELWQRGCANGDAASCAVANAALARDGSVVQQQVAEAATAGAANASTKVGSANAEPASVTARPVSLASSLSSAAEARATFDRMSRTGFMLIGIGAVAMGGAAFMAVQDDSPGGFHGPRGLYGEDRYSHAGFAVVLGALGLMSAGTGVAVLLSRPDPSGSQVGIGVAPGRLMLSGKIP